MPVLVLEALLLDLKQLIVLLLIASLLEEEILEEGELISHQLPLGLGGSRRSLLTRQWRTLTLGQVSTGPNDHAIGTSG